MKEGKMLRRRRSWILRYELTARASQVARWDENALGVGHAKLLYDHVNPIP